MAVNGRPIVTVPVNLFMDDLSANQSKRWSCLHAAQMQLAGLPIKRKNRTDDPTFLTASTSVSMMDLMRPIINDLNYCKK